MDFEGGRIDEEQARTARYLWLAVRHSLFADWDPIGVRESPEASDEYDAYASPILRMLLEKKSAAQIFDYLWHVETELMELGGNRPHTEAFARATAALPSVVAAQHPPHPDGWFGEHPASGRPMSWRVMWTTDRGVRGESYFETFDIAEYARGLFLREYSGGDVNRVPKRPDGTQITFTYMIPAEGSIVWAQVAPYDGEAP